MFIRHHNILSLCAKVKRQYFFSAVFQFWHFSKTGRHDIAESSIKHQKSTNSIATCSRASKTYLRLSDFKLIPANLQIQYCYLYSNARQKKISILFCNLQSWA
jgi:hypothetical protein